MTFDSPADRTLPDYTTVAFWAITRLGKNPLLSVSFSETADAKAKLVITGARDDNDDGVFEVLLCSTVPPAVGTELLHTQATIGSIVGTTRVDNVYEVVVTGGLTSDAATSCRYKLRNAFGVIAQNTVPAGRTWTHVLESENPTDLARMQTMLMNIAGRQVELALTKLGVDKSSEEIFGALLELAMEGNNLESLIATEFEKLEKDRRLGTWAPQVIGAAPAVD